MEVFDDFEIAEPLEHNDVKQAIVDYGLLEKREGSFVLVGNGRLYGGPFPFFKHAVIDDGLLDVVVFKRLGYLEIIKYLHDVVFRSDIRVPEIEYFQTRHLHVSSEQDVPLELDGELAGTCPVEFQMHEKALRVLAPSASG